MFGYTWALYLHNLALSRSPSSALFHQLFWGEGSPAKIELQKKVGTCIVISLLEDLAMIMTELGLKYPAHTHTELGLVGVHGSPEEALRPQQGQVRHGGGGTCAFSTASRVFGLARELHRKHTADGCEIRFSHHLRNPGLC